MAATALLAQVEIRDRRGELHRANNLCPGWIVDNFDRYTHPLLEHLFLTVTSVRSASRSPSRWRCSRAGGAGWSGPIVGFTGVLYTLPSLAVFFLLLPITGRGTTTAVIALTAYTLQIIFRNIVTGLERPAGRARRRAAGGPHRPPAAVAGGAAARAARHHRRPADRHDQHGRARDARGVRRSRRPRRADRGRQQHHLQDRVVAAGGLAVLLALALDVVLLAVQRVLTPWRRAQPA